MWKYRLFYNGIVAFSKLFVLCIRHKLYVLKNKERFQYIVPPLFSSYSNFFFFKCLVPSYTNFFSAHIHPRFCIQSWPVLQAAAASAFGDEAANRLPSSRLSPSSSSTFLQKKQQQQQSQLVKPDWSCKYDCCCRWLPAGCTAAAAAAAQTAVLDYHLSKPVKGNK